MNLTQLLTFVMVGIGLCFDTFAVSVSFGILKKEIQFRQAVGIALVLALVQTLFPVAGWLIGMSLKDLISSIDHWVAFGLLSIIGGRMVIEGIRKEEEKKLLDPTKPLILLGAAVATSIDSLVVGLSFGFLDTGILLPALIIGCITFVAAMLGMLFGKSIPGKTGHRSLIVGGIILILIGGKILLEHLIM